MPLKVGQSGYIPVIAIVIGVLIIAGFVITRRMNSDIAYPPVQNKYQEATGSADLIPSMSPAAKSTADIKIPPKTPLPSIPAVSNASSAPEASPGNSTQTSVPASPNKSLPDVSITTNCSGDHDGLGNHLDVTAVFTNLDKLNSNDLVISTIDNQAGKRSESHISTSLINNQTIPMHKYVYAFQGSTVPLELTADGREYVLRISKATYKPDGQINVYEFALEKKFSRQCTF